MTKYKDAQDRHEIYDDALPASHEVLLFASPAHLERVPHIYMQLSAWRRQWTAHCRLARKSTSTGWHQSAQTRRACPDHAAYCDMRRAERSAARRPELHEPLPTQAATCAGYGARTPRARPTSERARQTAATTGLPQRPIERDSAGPDNLADRGGHHKRHSVLAVRVGDAAAVVVEGGRHIMLTCADTRCWRLDPGKGTGERRARRRWKGRRCLAEGGRSRAVVVEGGARDLPEASTPRA